MPSGRISGWLALGIGIVSLALYVAITPPLLAAARSLEPLLVAATVVLSWIGIGLPVALRITSGRLAQSLTALALGIGMTGTLTFAMGLLRAFSATMLLLWLILGWVLLLLLGRRILPTEVPELDAWNAWGAAVILLFLGSLLPFVAAPEASTDALAYHLLIPRMYLERGGIERLPLFVESDYPCLAEYVYLPVLLLFDDETVCKGIHFWVGLAAAAAVSLLSAKISPGCPTLLAPALFLSMPVAAIHMGWAWNDLFFVLYVTLCLSSLVDHLEASPRRVTPALLAGILFGLASWMKYTFLLYFLPLAVLLLWAWRRHGLSIAHLLGFMGAFLAVASTWLLKNWALTGNPVYPLLNQLFGSPYWSEANAAMFQEANTSWEMPNFDSLDYLLWPITLPLRHPMVENQTGILPIVALPLVLRRLHGRSGDLLRLFALLTAVAWGAMFRTKSRSLLSLLALLFALAAAAIHESAALQGALRRALLAFLTAAVLVNLGMTMVTSYHLFDPVDVFLGRESREQYLSRIAHAERAFDHLNTARDVGSVALVELHEPYYLKRPFLFSSYSDTPVAEVIAGWAATPGELARAMRERGYTHLVVELRAWTDPHRRKAYSWSAEERLRFERFLREHCRVVMRDGPIQVFEIRAPTGPPR